MNTHTQAAEVVGSSAELGVMERLRQRTLPKHGGREADSWSHHWNLTVGDSELHAEAAREIERLHWDLGELRGRIAQMERDESRAVAAERERCAKPVPDEWLVKVRRLVQGFEHVSGIARLWEPDYSSGSERALWARATEACADVERLLREVEGPNDRVKRAGTAPLEQRG